jgi:hypothetical protein
LQNPKVYENRRILAGVLEYLLRSLIVRLRVGEDYGNFGIPDYIITLP